MSDKSTVPAYMSARDLAAYCGRSKQWVMARLREPAGIPHFVPGPGPKVMIRVADFDRWLEQYRTQPGADVERVVSDVMRRFRPA